ncbi:polysaccharide biosynthesis tyrosine autokinase [Muricauda ruestringensis]|jgi:capsular exopolysaccharide synthesis family protein|uniref:non-specific protein-tyrosine kinase n=1 Tax=Flagellimonas marinaquae TaxID=254955 RepID=A0AA48KN54_9FLAO|nr:tyrosine-protein kinase family protein [Allomuricauda ruestringensis]MCA0959889.1 polysaccharide biosynthesis tyrosine autokinase [Allomuricauda ruestringensis]BDW93829.1 tyrosine protein kinase [Allomuricauda aquimarina]
MNTKLDIKSILDSYLKHWKWFVLSVIVAFLLAFAYLRYTIPKYNASAKIQIIEDKGASSELSVLQDLDVFSGGKTRIEDEIEILKSRSNLTQVVKKLKLNVRYFVIGNIRDSELYGVDFPFNINFISADSIVNKSRHQFFIDLNSDTSFEYSEQEDAPFKKYDFGSKIQTNIGDIILVPNTKLLKSYKNKRLKVIVQPIPKVAAGYRQKINVSPAAEFSNIINISLTDPIQKRAIDVIDELVLTNNANAVADKKAIADRTTKFINDRITEIYSNLSSVDQTAESFKESRGIADLGSQSNVNFTQSAANEKQLQEANIQLNIANSMKDLINDKEGYDYIPTNVGLSDPGIANAAQRYNELIAQRNRLLESSNEKNPVIVKLDQQLEGLKRGMQSSLNNVTNNLDLQVNSLSKQLSQINSRIYAAPSNERALRDISRQQQTTESLYLYLLQKREESQITFASAAPKSKIVDSAYGSNQPVSPNKKIIYLLSIIIGLLIPFSVIYVIDLLDNKLHNKLDLEKIAGNVPVLVEIPKLGRKESKFVKNEDRSVLAEALRILRTNINYIQKSKKGDKNVIFVTSSVPGEGKTFVSSNLAAIYASTGKKVLLIGGDIRNPKLYNFFTEGTPTDGKTNLKPKRIVKTGLTEYLYDTSVSLNDIIVPTDVNTNKVDIIFSGKIPPNPTELLMSDRINDLFKEVSDLYDYVIVDTAPLMVVTDTLLISEHASQILYVVKAGATELKVLDFPLKLKEEGKLKGLSFVVNNVKQSNLGYGGKYGYGYGKTVKKWWKFS